MGSLHFREKLVEMNEKLSAIFNQIPGALLEKARFGRSENHAFWINAAYLIEVARRLRVEAGMSWLENFSCIQVDQSLVMTYFVRSSIMEPQQDTVILRVSFDLPHSSPHGQGDDHPVVSAPSVSEVWPIAGEFEVEIAKLFGVQFAQGKGHESKELAATENGWNGFPLRKDFVFPHVEREGGFR
jgi:NADH:ubiquinone oxidoreductase subunit C